MKEQEIIEKLKISRMYLSGVFDLLKFTDRKKDEQDFYLKNKFDKHEDELKDIKYKLDMIINDLIDND